LYKLVTGDRRLLRTFYFALYKYVHYYNDYHYYYLHDSFGLFIAHPLLVVIMCRKYRVVFSRGFYAYSTVIAEVSSHYRSCLLSSLFAVCPLGVTCL